METRILVTIREQYGRKVVHPACPQAKRLAKLAGTVTLTPLALGLAQDMGFEIHYVPLEMEGVPPLRVSAGQLKEMLR